MTHQESKHLQRETSGFWRTQEMFLIQEITKLIGKGLYFDQVARGALHLMSELLGLNRGRIVLKSPDENFYRIHYSYGLMEKEAARGRYNLGEGITGRAIQTNQLVIIQDIDKEPAFLARAVERNKLPEGVVSFLVCPVRVEEKSVGALACHRIRHRNRPLQDDVRILEIVCTLLGQLLALNDRLDKRLRAFEAQEQVHGGVTDQTSKYGIVGGSPALRHAITQIEQVANANVSVLLFGESGTGKELFAHALHSASPRKSEPFVKVNCAAIPDALFESELFGHERGSFTGATASRAGWFEQAKGGTIFLDEIGELPLLSQTKLLRTLQEGTVVRIGGKREIYVNMRLVAATNRDLSQAVEQGQFREDLFYRLNVIPIRLPSLAQRSQDIPLLIVHFLAKANAANHRHVKLTSDAKFYLGTQAWPGNIRQLANFIERLVLLAHSSVVDKAEVASLLADRAFDLAAPHPGVENSIRMPASYPPLRPYLSVASHSSAELLNALQQVGGNKSRAAQYLGLTERQLLYRLQKLGVTS